MRVYHFTSRKYGLEDLQRRRLKIATYDDLNDPFELLGPSSGDRNVRRRFEQSKTDLAVGHGMLCFSRSCKNPVLWSHYADKHRGLCLGLDIPKEWLTSVEYHAKRFEPDVAALDAGGTTAKALMKKIFSTKYGHWRYENEMRCFVGLHEKDESTGKYFMDFSGDIALREIIIGHCSTVSRAEINDALDNLASSVSAIKARLAFRSFEVVKQRDGTLWR